MMSSHCSAAFVAAALSSLAAPALALDLKSADIAPGAVIGAAHIYPRCGGQNLSPQLAWSGPPAGTKSLALTMIDMDVKPDLWSHWIVVGLPAADGGLPRGAKTLPSGAHGVKSNFGADVYEGPCPPKGTGLHHYRFTIWALAKDVPIDADEPATKVLAALRGAALAQASFTGTVQASQ